MILLFSLLTKLPFGGCVVRFRNWDGCVVTLQGGAHDTQDVGRHSRQVNG